MQVLALLVNFMEFKIKENLKIKIMHLLIFVVFSILPCFKLFHRFLETFEPRQQTPYLVCCSESSGIIMNN